MCVDRTKLSILNVGSNLFILLSRTVLNFVVRTVFIKILGQQYLGVSGLFDQIFTILSIADLGLGTAISYSLYKPLANNDYDEVSKLMSFYKKMYSYIGVVITIFGICLIPFLDHIMKGNKIDNTIIIYLLYLFNTVSVYFISYKDTLILADQRNYKLTKINFLADLFINVSQLIVLVIYKNFIFYLLSKIFITLLQRVFINRFISNEYRHVDFKNKNKLNGEVLDEIKVNIKAIFFHKIGNCLVSSTDNIIISSIFGMVKAGLYTNYLSLTSMVNTLLYSIFNGVTSSFGNLTVCDDKEKVENTFNILNFLGFLVFGFVSICFFVLMNDFIKMWVGADYLLPIESLFIICINFYITGIRYPLDTVKEAAGIYTQDRYISILHAISNLVISIFLSYVIGFNGVLLGTMISTLMVLGWNRPYTVYKYVFDKSSKKYFVDYLKKVVFLLFTGIVTTAVTSVVTISQVFINLIVKGIIVLVIYSILLMVFYRNNEYLRFYLKMIKKWFLV